MKILVAGAGGFIGGHLVNRLIADGHYVRAADIRPKAEWHQVNQQAHSYPKTDLRNINDCMMMCQGMDEVYMLAADMGGMGFIETHKLACMLSVLISTHMLAAAETQGVKRFFYSSSACVYAADKQTDINVTALSEADAYPAMPEDGYGWEKLFSERMARHFGEETGMVTRVARFHNVYGPHGAYKGGREKAPAAICRKVIEAKKSGNHTIDIWGDGEQTRSFMYVDDCVEGAIRILGSEVPFPLNLGSEELISVNALVSMVEDIAGVDLKRTYDLTAPQGVRGRNSDNTLIQEELGWAPSTLLRDGMEATYKSIYNEMSAS